EIVKDDRVAVVKGEGVAGGAERGGSRAGGADELELGGVDEGGTRREVAEQGQGEREEGLHGSLAIYYYRRDPNAAHLHPDAGLERRGDAPRGGPVHPGAKLPGVGTRGGERRLDARAGPAP